VVKTGDKFYAKAADDVLQEKGECGGAVTATLKYLLQNRVVDGVLAMGHGADIYDGKPKFITDPKRVTELSGSLRCAPILHANVLRKYLNGAKDMRIAVVGVGCDCVALEKLGKKGVINVDNLILIGLNCGGMLPPVKAQEMIQKLFETDPTDVVNEEIANGYFIIETTAHERKELRIDDLEEMGWGRRANCRRCEVKIPRMADLAFGKWGVTGPDSSTATFVEVCSEAGAQLLGDAIVAGALITEDPLPRGLEVRDHVEKAMLKLAAKWQRHDFVTGDAKDEYWLAQFSKCIKCYGCIDACPICACDNCKIECKEPLWIESNELPPSPKFQFTRAAHMSDDCVNCGQCEDACPAEIPLSTFFQQSSKEYAKLFARFDELTSM